MIDVNHTPGGRNRGGWLGTVGVVVAAAVPLAFLAVFFAYPVAMLVARGFVTDGALDLGGVAEVFSSSRTWRIVGQVRSEEHTSELQSRGHLVCRLLLEKNNITEDEKVDNTHVQLIHEI